MPLTTFYPLLLTVSPRVNSPSLLLTPPPPPPPPPPRRCPSSPATNNCPSATSSTCVFPMATPRIGHVEEKGRKNDVNCTVIQRVPECRLID
ncbi:hypothetical protein BO82DRAFT_41338 [Aspergillus uvarum CBS 121591]|uniref:Uncharacterized protein n=1 Tax=Aspergillus uvarum CBS 121591 TaxID=1448315 RepID=A0A319CCU1_9EURO|nr:hypothetical protein BO82DRAFT_41338 [Aspergillus uvarum CBS 121591]PYH83455.1 hypothetical protein BO82DRAFT_41338 [Aspergillus uvarum CBS 121591]